MPEITISTTRNGKIVISSKNEHTHDRAKLPSIDVICSGNMLVNYEDNNAIFIMANPNNTALTPNEFVAEGHDKRIIIVDKVSGVVTFIENVEAVRNFHIKLNSFLHENGLTTQDFLMYTKRRYMGDLFDTFVDMVGSNIEVFP